MKQLLFVFCLFITGYLFSNNQQMQQQQAYSGSTGNTEIILTKINFSIQIGVLRQNVPKGLLNPSEYVLEDGYLYKGCDYRINGINIVDKTKKDLDKWAGKPVVIYYRQKTDLNQILVKDEKAPEDYGKEESMMQMRSDWVSPETGFQIGRTTKEKLKGISYYEVYDIVPYTGFKIKSDDTMTHLTIVNDFDVPMTDIKVTGHYEGGSGKPMPKYVPNSFKGLNPKAELSLSLKKYIPNSDKNKLRGFGLESLIVEFFINSEAQKIELFVS